LLKYPNHIIINSKSFNGLSLSDSNKCLWLWDDDENHSKPKTQKTLKTGKLETHVAEFKYTLFYSLSPAQECR